MYLYNFRTIFHLFIACAMLVGCTKFLNNTGFPKVESFPALLSRPPLCCSLSLKKIIFPSNIFLGRCMSHQSVICLIELQHVPKKSILLSTTNKLWLNPSASQCNVCVIMIIIVCIMIFTLRHARKSYRIVLSHQQLHTPVSIGLP